MSAAPGLAVLLALSGCARDLARVSSGTIGCPTDEIEIADVSVGWSETSWIARCRGLTFTCAGEHAPSCVPERAAALASP
jgi:hypothetical protein